MRGLLFAILVLELLCVGVASADTAPSVSFEPPTPADNSIIDKNYVEIKVNVGDAADLSAFIFNWNGEDYNIYDDSLVLQMNFNNNPAIGESSTKAVDVSRYGNNGTIHGATYVDGRYGKALQFDGYDDYAEVPDDNSLDLASHFTVSLWFKAITLPYGMEAACLIDKGTSWKRNYGIYVTPGGGILYLTHVSSGEIYRKYDAAGIQAGKWYHVAITADGNVMSLYINGVKVDSVSAPSPYTTYGYPLSFGKRYLYNDLKFNGIIDEVRIYNRALSDEEIKMLYHSTFWKYTSSSWKFYANITGLSDGKYTFYALARDTNGNEGRSDVRHFTVSTTPTPIPEFPAIIIPAMIAIGILAIKRRQN